MQPHGPYLLGGACFGGVVAYELAQEFRRGGERVELLVLMETWPPSSLPEDTRRIWSALDPFVFFLKRSVAHLRGLRSSEPREWLSYLKGRLAIVREIIERKDVFRGDRSILHEDRVSSANYRAMARYQPGEYQGDIHLVMANSSPAEGAQDTRRSWSSLVSGRASIVKIDAEDSGHLLLPPHVDALADYLANAIDSRHRYA